MQTSGGQDRELLPTQTETNGRSRSFVCVLFRWAGMPAAKMSTQSLCASTAAPRNTQEDARRLCQPDITGWVVNDASEQRERWVRVIMGFSALRERRHFAGLAFVRDAREPRVRAPHVFPACLPCYSGSRNLAIPGPFPPTLPVHGTSRTRYCSEAAITVVFRQRFGQYDGNVPPDDDDGAICDGICCWALDLSSDSIGACIVACYCISGHTNC